MPKGRFIAWIAFAALLCTGQGARAGVLFTGTGINPETGTTATGSAEFSISGSTLTIVLTNTTVGGSGAQGNSLTGITFDINPGSPALTYNLSTGIALTAGSNIYTSMAGVNNATPLGGSWTNVLGATPLGEYGVAATGFNGAFNGGSIATGNGGPNYGIVSAGTFPAGPFGGAQFPFIQNSLTFTFGGAGGVSESQISNVKLLFGTDGTGIITTTSITALPEPSSVLMALSAVAGVGGFAGWRRRRLAK